MNIDHSVLEIGRNQEVLQIPSHDYQFYASVPAGIKHSLRVARRACKVAFSDNAARYPSLGGKP